MLRGYSCGNAFARVLARVVARGARGGIGESAGRGYEQRLGLCVNRVGTGGAGGGDGGAREMRWDRLFGNEGAESAWTFTFQLQKGEPSVGAKSRREVRRPFLTYLVGCTQKARSLVGYQERDRSMPKLTK